MDSDILRNLFEAVRSGRVDIDEAVRRAGILPFLDTDHGRIDTHRALRQGIPEVIFGQSKTPEQIVGAARALRRSGQTVLVTRVAESEAAAILEMLPEADYHAVARTVWIGPAEVPVTGKGTVLVVSAGSADRPGSRASTDSSHPSIRSAPRAFSSSSPEWRARCPLSWAVSSTSP